MTSRFAVLAARQAGKQTLAAAQAAGGGRNQWDGVLPASNVPVEWPADQEAPTGYWISNLPPDTPVADLVRWAKMRWRIEHDYRELEHVLCLDHFEGRTWLRLAPPRHPRHRRPCILSLYQALDLLQELLKGWTGTCTTCNRPLPRTRTQMQNLTKHYLELSYGSLGG